MGKPDWYRDQTHPWPSEVRRNEENWVRIPTRTELGRRKKRKYGEWWGGKITSFKPTDPSSDPTPATSFYKLGTLTSISIPLFTKHLSSAIKEEFFYALYNFLFNLNYKQLMLVLYYTHFIMGKLRHGEVTYSKSSKFIIKSWQTDLKSELRSSTLPHLQNTYFSKLWYRFHEMMKCM